MHGLRTCDAVGADNVRSASWPAGKLKELGNTVLGKFGMSIDNFQAVKDPATGSYSINFQQ
jgi:hypothetical protein